MDFEMFKKELQEKVCTVLKERNGGGFINEGLFQTEEGNNIIFYPEGGLAGITINAMDCYADFQAGRTMEAVVQAVFYIIEEQLWEEKEIRMLEQMAVPENIVPVLVSREVNEELLDEIPHIPFQEMEIIFKFIFWESGNGMKVSCNVPKSYMDECGWDEERLFNLAMRNKIYKDQIHVMPFKQMTDALLLGNSGEELKSDWEGIRDDPMKVVLITNSHRTYGAAGILDRDVLERVSSIYGEDLYLLLPSIHECLAVPKGTMPLVHLREMVWDMNQNLTARKEWLSDNVYVFEKQTKEIRLAGQEEKN